MGKGELRMMMRMSGMMIEKSVEMEVMAHEMRYVVGEGTGGCHGGCGVARCGGE